MFLSELKAFEAGLFAVIALGAVVVVAIVAAGHLVTLNADEKGTRTISALRAVILVFLMSVLAIGYIRHDLVVTLLRS